MKITAIKDVNWEERLKIALKKTGTNDQRVNKLMAKGTESDYRKAF